MGEPQDWVFRPVWYSWLWEAGVRPRPILQSYRDGRAGGREPATPAEDGKHLEKSWNNTQTVLLGFLGGFFFPLIALAILTETDISLTIFKGYKCFMSLSSTLRQQLLLMLGVSKTRSGAAGCCQGPGHRPQGEDPAPYPHGKSSSPPHRVLSFPPIPRRRSHRPASVQDVFLLQKTIYSA